MIPMPVIVISASSSVSEVRSDSRSDAIAVACLIDFSFPAPLFFQGKSQIRF